MTKKILYGLEILEDLGYNVEKIMDKFIIVRKNNKEWAFEIHNGMMYKAKMGG